MAAANSGFGDGLVYVSTNAGVAWNATSAPPDQWASVVVSANGGVIVAADSGYGDGLIYISTNTGVSWTAGGTLGFWNSVAASADGSVLSAVAYPGGIYLWEGAPELGIARSGTNLLLSWQNFVSASGFAPQQNTNLASANWVNVTNQSLLTNGLSLVTLPMASAGNHFYRLKK